MRSSRKIVLALTALTASLLVLLVAVPFLFRDRISSRLKVEIGRSVNARVAWGDVGMSVLRDFPNATLRLDGLSVTGVKPFVGDTLVAARRIRLVLDVGSVVRHLRRGDAIVVREIDVDRPVVRLLVLRDGTANWDIARAPANSPSGSARAVDVSLRRLRIHDGAVVLDDRQSGLAVSVAGLDEALSGDFARDDAVLSTRTRADSVSLRFAGVPYLSGVKLELIADVAADLKGRRFSFTNDSLRLNNLVLAFSGSVQAGEPNLALDLTMAAPGTAFRDILSLVPAIYARDFQRLRTSGTMSASARVRGQYGPDAFPAVTLRARVENGAFQYPDLPMPVRDIFVDLAVDNPGGHLDSTVVELKRFHARLGRQPVDARFVMRTPVSDPDVELRLAGTLDLADARRTVKLGGVDELSGVVVADVAMRAHMSDLDAGRYDRVDARGTVNVARLAVRSAELPRAVAVDTAAIRLTPRRAELASFAGRVGRSDVRATGSVDNLLGYALRGDVLRGRAAVNSELFDLDEWRSDDETLEVIPVPANVDFALQATAARVKYRALAMSNVHGGLRVKDRRVTLEDLHMDMLRGSVVANGFYETADVTRPTFDIGVKVATIDIPTAFAALSTVQKLAPVARWAQGAVSGDFALKGALGRDMMPAFDALTGRGSVESGRLVLQGVPVLTKLAESLAIDRLANPAIDALRASFEIADGRLHVRPFDVRMAGTSMTVSGSHGIDQSLSYDLTLAVPRAELGEAGGRAVARLASQAGKGGIDLAAGEVVELGAHVSGTVTNPTVKPNFSGIASSAREAAHYAVRREVETRVADVKQRADSAVDDARRRARAEADRVTRLAEQQSAAMREQARVLAAKVKQEGNDRADALLANATSPAARIAAQVAANRMRREADAQAARGVREADAKADALVLQAKKQADALVPQGS